MDYRRFQHIIQTDFNLDSNVSIVVGVSGGVDSMVLLHLLYSLPEEIRPIIYVAHVNHQLRKESSVEQKFVENYAKSHQLSCFVGVWQEGPTIKTNVEYQAREFRYHFFEEIMTKTGSQYLLTAHHKDDNIETILMRFIQGNQLRSLSGIENSRPFRDNKVIRPLLSFSKNELYRFAKAEDIPYYEDSSNFSEDYLRNRIRHSIRPRLEEENPKFGDGVLRLAQEIKQQTQLVDSLIAPIIEEVISYQNNTWQLDKLSLKRHNLAVQSEVIRYLLTQIQEKADISVSYEHQVQILHLLDSDQPNQQIDLENRWVFEKSYDDIRVFQKQSGTTLQQGFLLETGQGIFLSPFQWLGFFEDGKEMLPEQLKTWKSKEITYDHELNHSIRVRKREDGDRFVYNRNGQTKKVSRYFIDEKIPMKLRELSWLIFDENDRLIWLLPFRESYLSIANETDKIHYKLVYLYQEDE